jgi:peptidoglycan/LPS O-acetylase OafA/YrhL
MNKLNDWVFGLYDKAGLDWHSPFEYDWLNVFYVLFLLFAISIVLYKFMEEPLNNYIRNYLFLKLNKAPKPASETVPANTEDEKLIKN